MNPVKVKLEQLKPKTRLQKAVIKGILFLIKFFKNKRNFISQGPNWILCLLSLICSTCPNNDIRSIVKELINYELTRMSLLLNKSAKDSVEYFPIYFYALVKANAPKDIKQRFKKYYIKHNIKKKLARDFKEFDDTDYDSISSVAIDHMFVRIAKSSARKLGVTLPKEEFNKYWKTLSKINNNSLFAANKNYPNVVDYHVTHVIYIYNQYNCKHVGKGKKSKYIRDCEKYLHKHSNRILHKSHDVDLIAETLECMYVLGNKKWIKKFKSKYISKILKQQRKRTGAWQDRGKLDMYEKFHGTWACVNALYHFY